jgi:hypothetical protein
MKMGIASNSPAGFARQATPGIRKGSKLLGGIMKVWLVSEGNCTCCMMAIAAFSSEEKANAYAEKTDSRYVDVDWVILDEEE